MTAATEAHDPATWAEFFLYGFRQSRAFSDDDSPRTSPQPTTSTEEQRSDNWSTEFLQPLITAANEFLDAEEKSPTDEPRSPPGSVSPTPPTNKRTRTNNWTRPLVADIPVPRSDRDFRGERAPRSFQDTSYKTYSTDPTTSAVHARTAVSRVSGPSVATPASFDKTGNCLSTAPVSWYDFRPLKVRDTPEIDSLLSECVGQIGSDSFSQQDDEEDAEEEAGAAALQWVHDSAYEDDGYDFFRDNNSGCIAAPGMFCYETIAPTMVTYADRDVRPKCAEPECAAGSESADEKHATRDRSYPRADIEYGARIIAINMCFLLADDDECTCRLAADTEQRAAWKDFEAKAKPTIGLSDYGRRICDYFPEPKIVSEHAVLYIERMLAHNPGLRLTMANAHRVLLAAAFVAMKYSSDDFYETTYISKIGGISVPELCKLELRFLQLCGFDLYTKDSDFSAIRRRAV